MFADINTGPCITVGWNRKKSFPLNWLNLLFCGGTNLAVTATLVSILNDTQQDALIWSVINPSFLNKNRSLRELLA
jgi:hypothetical protein